MKRCCLGLGMAVFLLPACQKNKLEQVERVIEKVRQEYAPDRRTALFELSAVQAGGKVLVTGETNLPMARSAVIRCLDSAGIAWTDSVKVLPDGWSGDKTTGVAALSVVNMRYEPGHSAELVTQVLLGTPVEILKRKGGWCLVQMPDKYIAWTGKDDLAMMDSLEFSRWRAVDKLVYTADYGHAYAGPSERSSFISDLVKGDILELAGMESGFYRVAYPDGRRAYIPENAGSMYRDWVTSLDPSPERVLEAASRMMGVPYLWGGTSVKGVDCSGFTKTAYYMNGLILPRDASQQVLAGEAVSIRLADTVNISEALKNLRKGDLVFFTNDPSRRNDPGARITHVGIYMDQGEFIHSSGRVKVNSLSDTAANYNERRALTLAAARRVLTSVDKNGIISLQKHPLY